MRAIRVIVAVIAVAAAGAALAWGIDVRCPIDGRNMYPTGNDTFDRATGKLLKEYSDSNGHVAWVPAP